MNRGITRREAIAAASAATIGHAAAKVTGPLDRKTIVDRHSPVTTSVDIQSALQVGNGEFAFAMDATGLQTFQEEYRKGMPLGTMAQWAWHSVPNTGNYQLSEVMKEYDSHGRVVSYPVGINEFGPAPAGIPERIIASATWLRENPQRIHLARIGLVRPRETNVAIPMDAISGVEQKLDLWSGRVDSRFQLFGAQVRIETACHPQRDVLGVRIVSPLLADGRLGLLLAFPYASTSWNLGYDWNSPDRYQTQVVTAENGAVFESILDSTRYWSSAQWSAGAKLQNFQPHVFHLTAEGHEQLELTIEFSRDQLQSSRLSVAEVRAACIDYWPRFWQRGGAIDFSDCTDERAPELERRVVLSQYATAVNCAGSMPPQETGLVTNSWYGKSHLEMHWWHASHFVLWGRPELLERSLPWYRKILPRARDTAKQQGYRGARWPKEIGPEGRETPSDIGVFLIWQQPHPIFYSELLYRLRPERSTLDGFKEIVFETAEFMASYAAWDNSQKRYVLGPDRKSVV